MRRLALAGLIGLAGTLLPAQVQEFRLPSGLRCLLLEKHEQPLIRVALDCRWEPSEEPARKPGLAGFLAAVMRAGGAGPYTRPEYNRALDDLGLALGFESRRNGFRWTLACDSRNQEPALELLAHAVFRPVFDPALVAAQRRILSRQLLGASPWERGQSTFLWSLGDPGVELVPTGTELKNMEFDDLQAFRRQVVRPGNATLVLQGDLSLVQAKELVTLHFGLWGPAVQPRPEEPAAEAEPPARLLAVLDPSPDAELWAGREPGACPPAVAELLGLLLDHLPQGPGPGTRSTGTCRAGDPVVVRVKAGPADREGLVAALEAVLARLRGGVSAQDLDRLRQRWKARKAALALHPRDLIRALADGSVDPALEAKVDALRPEDFNAALKTLLAPGSLRFLLVGGDARVAQAAEKAGFGPATLMLPMP